MKTVERAVQTESGGEERAGGVQAAGRKREIAEKAKKGLGIREVLLTGILLAAGAVLKYVAGSFINFGMKPNFIIAMYCLVILLIRPRFAEAVIIGILAGAICQFFPGQPYINFVSELLGAAAMCFLVRIPLHTGKVPVKTLLCTFFSTLASGFSFIGIMYLVYYAGADITPTPLAVFLAIILGTACINSVIVQMLYLPMRLILKIKDGE
ncbi:MAG: hypothetical protein LBK08_11760 [Treponema sp.]|jgi:hypothetical protein|nr:hypothetical protein [Treponema sp.]